MAGVGITLRKFTEDSSLHGLIRANLYSGVMSSGSWILSISSLLLIYFYVTLEFGATLFSIQFIVCVTYLTSASLILSSVFQQITIRYVADQIYIDKRENIAGALFAVSLVLCFISASFAIGACYLFIPKESLTIKIILISGFVTLNNLAIFSNALSGLKDYGNIVFSFFIANGLIIFLAYYLYWFYLPGLLSAFLIGQVVLVAIFWVETLNHFPSRTIFDFKVFKYFKDKKLLVLSSIMIQLSFWIDKYIFWLSPNVSTKLLGKLGASPIYDLPMFIAFVTMIPGIAVFFYQVETHFARFYHRYYDAINKGATIDEIELKHSQQVSSARDALFVVMVIQAIIGTSVIYFAPDILRILGIAPISVFLLRIDALSTFFVVMFLATINLLYYLARIKAVAIITSFYFITNMGLTYLSLILGPPWFGYGLLASTFLSVILAICFLNHAFKYQTYETFMFN